MRMIHLLLISGGSLVGQNILQAIGERRSRFHLEATNSLASEPSLVDFDEVHLVPATALDTSALERLVRQRLRDGSCQLVIPCRDEEVLWLARLLEQLDAPGSRLMVGAPWPAEVFLDKALSWSLSAAHGLPFVPTARLEDRLAVEGLVRAHPGPLIVKPCRGFASRGVWVLRDADQLAAHQDTPDLVVQPWLGPTETVFSYLAEAEHRGLPLFHSFESTKHSIQAFIAPDGAVTGVFVTIHVMNQGISRHVEASSCPQALSLGHRTAEAFAAEGWRGPLNIQCQRRDDDAYTIYEYNGRFTGATAARALLGFDELAMALQAFAGISLPPRTERFAAATKQPLTRGLGPQVATPSHTGPGGE
jgi:biotin carboxylase